MSNNHTEVNPTAIIQHMKVAVVGGGVVGLAAAYYLSDRGADVVVLEKNRPGTGSTERSAGGIRQQFSTGVNVELSRESYEVWDEFESGFGVDIGFRKVGYLFLARTEATAALFRENVDMQHDLGVTSSSLSPAEAHEHCPGLLPERFEAATFLGTDGFADPNLAVQGYARAAEAEGAVIRTNTPVTDVCLCGDTVTGVEVDGNEVLDADFVVNAAGAWSGRLAEMAGVTLPVEPRRRQIAIAEPTSVVPEDTPMTIDLDTGSYFRPEREGATLVGGEFGDEDPAVDPDTFSKSLDFEWAATAVEHAADYTTYFDEDTRIVRGWAGLYAVTPDHHPVIEEVVPGFVTAAGFSGHGFQHAPATGKLVAELVLDGDPSLVDIDRLTSERFETGDLLIEHNIA